MCACTCAEEKFLWGYMLCICCLKPNAHRKIFWDNFTQKYIETDTNSLVPSRIESYKESFVILCSERIYINKWYTCQKHKHHTQSDTRIYTFTIPLPEEKRWLTKADKIIVIFASLYAIYIYSYTLICELVFVEKISFLFITENSVRDFRWYRSQWHWTSFLRYIARLRLCASLAFIESILWQGRNYSAHRI